MCLSTPQPGWTFLQTPQKEELQGGAAASTVPVEEQILLVLQLLLVEGCSLEPSPRP